MNTDTILTSIRSGCSVEDLMYVITYVEFLKRTGFRVDGRLRKLRNVLAHWAEYKCGLFEGYEDFLIVDEKSLSALLEKVGG